MANDTAATAATIMTLPFAVSGFDVSGRANDPSYTPDCASGASKTPAWWSFIPPSGCTAIGLFVDTTDESQNYQPLLSVWTGPDAAHLTEVPFQCFTTGVPTIVQISVVPGTQYWLQIINDGPAPPNTTLIFKVYNSTNLAVPAGSIFNPGDVPNFPGVILSPTTGALLQAIGISASLAGNEAGIILPNGIFALPADDPHTLFVNAIKGFNGNALVNGTFPLLWSVTSTIIPNQNRVSPITTDQAHNFYVSARDDTNPAKVNIISDTGVVSGTSYTLAASSVKISAMALNPAVTKLYYSTLTSGDGIYVFDLGALITTTFVAGVAKDRHGFDLLVLSTGDVLTPYSPDQTANPVVNQVRRYDPTGALLSTYVLGPASIFYGSIIPRIWQALDDPNSFWVVDWPTLGFARIQNIKVSDGSVLAGPFSVPLKDAVSISAPTFGPAQTCPYFLLRGPLAPRRFGAVTSCANCWNEDGDLEVN